MRNNEVIISDVYLYLYLYIYISIPSLQMTGTTSVRRKENRQEKMMKDEGGNADGDECWSP